MGALADLSLGWAGIKDGLKHATGLDPNAHEAADVYAEQSAAQALSQGADVATAEQVRQAAQVQATEAEAQRQVLTRAADATPAAAAEAVKENAKAAGKAAAGAVDEATKVAGKGLGHLAGPLSLVLIPVAVVALVYVLVTSGALSLFKSRAARGEKWG